VKAAREWWNRPTVEVAEAGLRATQVQLALRYRQAVSSGGPLPSLRDVGFRVHSDVDEDGILLYVFSLLGDHPRTLVDIGSASVSASNTANLLQRHSWTGLLVDADESSVEDARRAYAGHVMPPQLVCSFVTAENVNSILRENGAIGEIGLLCIDIDGMDYWIWRAIDVIAPLVVLIEFQDILGPERSVTVPYSPDFRVRDHPVNAHSNDYAGASLSAMVKLGREKGYRLVGVNRLGFNAFFVRNDLVPDLLPEVSAKECLVHPWNEYGQRERYPRVADLEWLEV
jgi:hypothetical protein